MGGSAPGRRGKRFDGAFAHLAGAELRGVAADQPGQAFAPGFQRLAQREFDRADFFAQHAPGQHALEQPGHQHHQQRGVYGRPPGRACDVACQLPERQGLRAPGRHAHQQSPYPPGERAEQKCHEGRAAHGHATASMEVVAHPDHRVYGRRRLAHEAVYPQRQPQRQHHATGRIRQAGRKVKAGPGHRQRQGWTQAATGSIWLGMSRRLRINMMLMSEKSRSTHSSSSPRHSASSPVRFSQTSTGWAAVTPCASR
jgi:hypothetical protein